MRNKYTNIIGGINRNYRKMLDIINRKLKEPFTVSEASNIIGLDYKKTSRLLAYWVTNGWLSRVRKGLYITVPLGTINPHERKENPWIIASKLFTPCYIGGWSACEHWGFTEQIFNDIVVISSRKIRKSKNIINGTNFIIKSIVKYKFFGFSNVWVEQTKVNVSDPTRTIVDILDDPSIGGGIRTIADIVREYFSGEYKDENKLLDYLKRFPNKAVNKRLGYLLETLNLRFRRIIDFCSSNISTGYSILDPAIKKKGTITRRWNLRVNVTINPEITS